MSETLNEVVIVVIGGTIIVLLLLIFIISFFFIHQRRQTQNRLEKADLKAQYEQEILNAENEIQESTMHHISRELHDNVSQMLTLVKIKLNQLAVQQPDVQVLTELKEYTAKAIADISGLSKSLNQENILAEGLGAAIAFELARVQRSTGIDTTLANEYAGGLDHKKEILVFRIFQECLQNILKHAAAKNITVNLEETENSFNLVVSDNGVGFDTAATLAKAGFGAGAGLHNLQHRASLLGGRLTLQSTPEAGTQTTLTIPLSTPNDYHSAGRRPLTNP